MDSIKTILDSETKKGRTPSVQYLFFSVDKILYDYATGYADLKTGLKIDQNTSFNFFSITKTFTALAIMQLVEANFVSLEKSVSHYLPSSKISEHVMVKHLLNHSSGLANPIPLNWIHLSSEHQNFSPKEFFNPILEKNKKLKFQPGSKFKYSNLGYVYLGLIIEAASQMNYEDYVKKNILNRLHLEPYLLDFEISNENLHAKGYHSNRSISNLLLNFLLDKSKYMAKSFGKWKPFKPYYVNGPSYGGLIGNARGLLKYGQEMLKENNNLISHGGKELLFTENVDGKGKSTGVGLSWFTGNLNEFKYVAHAGGGGGFYSELRLYPQLKLGSLIMFNRSGFKDEKYLNKLDLPLLKNYVTK